MFCSNTCCVPLALLRTSYQIMGHNLLVSEMREGYCENICHPCIPPGLSIRDIRLWLPCLKLSPSYIGPPTDLTYLLSMAFLLYFTSHYWSRILTLWFLLTQGLVPQTCLPFHKWTRWTLLSFVEYHHVSLLPPWTASSTNLQEISTLIVSYVFIF